MAVFFFLWPFSGQVFGPFGDADVLRQIRPKGTSDNGVRVHHGRSFKQHNQKWVRSYQSVHVFWRISGQSHQDPIRTHVQTVPGSAV